MERLRYGWVRDRDLMRGEMPEAITGKTVVLIVEDEPLILMSVSDYLHDCGLTPLEAASGDEALCILCSRDDIDIVFTDVNMPGNIDGLELSRIVGDQWPTILTVVTSGKVRPGKAELPERTTFIPKPYDLNRVVEVFTHRAERRSALTQGTP